MKNEMDTYIITAKTVEEAISAAKKQYEDENHEISYEILEMPKKGLFGLGAKDAKIRVTVTKAEKVELGSLVAEMRSMRNLTDRNGDSDKPKKKPEQKQNQNQNGQPKEQKEQKPKQAQPNQPKEQAQPGQKQTQQTPPKPQNADVPPKEQTQPKPPKPPKESKPNQPKPQPQKEPVLPEEAAREPALPKEAPAPETVPETPAVPAAETPVPETPEAAPSAASAASAGAKFGDASAEYKSSLHNSAKPNRRPPQKPSSGAQTEKIDSAAVTVSQPMGLADFVSDGAPKEFGKSSGSGRMNNDVKRKKKPAPAASAGRNSSAGQNPKPAAQKPVNPAPNGRYDFAESDDDYKKLDELVRESENELEAAEAAVLVPRPASAEASADEELSPVLPEHEERRREAITQEEMDFALAFANQLMENMKLNARAVPASCPEGEEFEVTEEANVYPKIDIVGDDTGILIGHHGETLDSIQYLVNLSALRKSKSKDGDYVKIVVDIENYRAKREETLRTLARRMAARAVKYKRNVFLEPMNAYERRIIHSELQTFENVSTHSVGTDRDRKIIITYEGPDKQPDNRSMNGTRPANGTRPTGRKRRETAPAGGNDAGGTNPAVGTNPAGENRSGARRRPRKTQKMPIEKIGELLPGGDEKSE